MTTCIANTTPQGDNAVHGVIVLPNLDATLSEITSCFQGARMGLVQAAIRYVETIQEIRRCYPAPNASSIEEAGFIAKVDDVRSRAGIHHSTWYFQLRAVWYLVSLGQPPERLLTDVQVTKANMAARAAGINALEEPMPAVRQEAQRLLPAVIEASGEAPHAPIEEKPATRALRAAVASMRNAPISRLCIFPDADTLVLVWKWGGGEGDYYEAPLDMPPNQVKESLRQDGWPIGQG